MKKVFSFEYTLKDPQGNLIDSSEGHGPLKFLEGSSQIIPGLEKEILLLNEEDSKRINVKAEEAYGPRHEDLVMEVEKTQFPEDQVLNVGDQFQVNDTPDAPIFSIIAITDTKVTLDGNHPLAGIDLSFDVKVTEVRQATEEEIAHGHAH